MIRPATFEDSARWLAIRNDPEARFWSGQRAPINKAEHEAWFSRALISREEGLYVENQGEDGVISYGRVQQVGLVSLAVDPHWRGHGLGKEMLAFLEKETRRVGLSKLLAVIHPSNVPSVRAFMRAGYTTHPVSEVVLQRLL